MMDLTGKTILHFHVLGQLGRGGMSVVYKARDMHLNRIVALKIPHLLMLSEVETARFETEARAAAALHHPYICTIYSLHKSPEFTFIAMEFVEGETLKNYIRRSGSIFVKQSVDIMVKLADALAAAHAKGIVHRDVKSDNVMLTSDGSVKLMDFGLARLKEGPRLTRTGEVVGTAAYMSPEQAEGRPVDQRTDLWSLGVVFYEMLTGQLPFAGDSDVSTLQKIIKAKPPAVRTFKKGIPQSVQYVLHTLLEKEPGYRYANACLVVNDLQKSVATPGLRLLLRTLKKKMWYAIITLLFIAIVSIATIYTIQQKRNLPPWLQPNVPMVRLTTESGTEHGSISPSGRYLAYLFKGLSGLKIMDLSTREIVLIDTGLYVPVCPAWYPDESRLVISIGAQTIMDTPILWAEKKLAQGQPLFKCDSCYIHQLIWSPDGQWVSAFNMCNRSSSLGLHRSDRSVDKSLYSYKQRSSIIQSAWHPDSRHLSYYHYSAGENTRSIRTMDIVNGEVSKDLVEVFDMPAAWLSGGLAVSPDDRYIVFPDSCEGAMELLALPISHNGMNRAGATIRLTRFCGNGMPLWPYLNKNGRTLSFVLDASYQDIYVAPFDVKNKSISNAMTPVCTDRRMNREAYWTADGKSVVFVSPQQNQLDIYLWNRQTQKTSRLTYTAAEEKLLRCLPDQPSVGFLYNGVIYAVAFSDGQRRRVYPPVEDSAEKQVYNYDWGKTSDTLYVILLPGPNQPGNAFPLKRVILSQGMEQLLYTFSKTLSPPWIEIRRSPTGDLLAYRQPNGEKGDSLEIGVVNLNKGLCQKVVRQSAMTPNGQISWSADGSSLFYRNNAPNAKVYGQFYLKSLSSGAPQQFHIPERFEDTNPGLISPTGDEIILYVERNEADIWAMGDVKVGK